VGALILDLHRVAKLRRPWPTERIERPVHAQEHPHRDALPCVRSYLAATGACGPCGRRVEPASDVVEVIPRIGRGREGQRRDVSGDLVGSPVVRDGGTRAASAGLETTPRRTAGSGECADQRDNHESDAHEGLLDAWMPLKVSTTSWLRSMRRGTAPGRAEAPGRLHRLVGGAALLAASTALLRLAIAVTRGALAEQVRR
jgi:hypothetical protein